MRLKQLTTILLLILACFPAFSQKTDEIQSFKFYARIFGSYGFLTSGSFKAPSSLSTTTQNGSSTFGFTAQKKGMGAGFRYGAGFGFIINKIINVGIDGEYLMGTNLVSNSSTNINDSILINLPQGATIPNASATTNATENYVLKNNILSIIPSITFKAINTDKYYIYTRVGLIIGIPLKIEVSDTIHSLYQTSLPPTTPTDYLYYNEVAANSTYKYKSNPGIGYQAALGIAFIVSSNMRIYAEAVSNSLTLHPVEYDQTYHTTTTTTKKYNGATNSVPDHSLTIQQFKESGDSKVSTTGTFPNQTIYYQSPQISMAVNSLNFGIGILFNF